MMKTIYISLILILALSCSDKNVDIQINDWGKELIGVGYIGENPDSLKELFSYYPQTHNQPGKLKEVFKHTAFISEDTLIIPNVLLYTLFRDIKLDKKITEDSSTFIINKTNSLYKFSKIKGHDFVPNIIYFDKLPNKYPDLFDYQYIDGFDYFGHYKIEIISKDSIKVWLKSATYFKYLYKQYEINEIDDLFISSYLNLSCLSRYDTINYNINNAIFCGSTLYETLVYNDSLFRYKTYFRKYPGAGMLVNYFRSKINADIDSLKDVNLDEKSPIDGKHFNSLPIAFKNRQTN